MKEEKEENDSELMIWGGIGIVIILGLWITTYFILKDIGNTERGTLGDMFGSINALFSGLALAGIIFTILLQRKELGYQRRELRATRLEFYIQNETLRLQRFENTFFNLLSLHHQIVESMDFYKQIEKKNGSSVMITKKEYGIVTVKSRDVFKQKYDDLLDYIVLQGNKSLNKSYLDFYGSVQTDFGHYFRNLYRIIKFVHETEFASKEDLNINIESKAYKDRIAYSMYNHKIRYKYTSMIRAQLSDYELLWIFYNCLSENGNEKFKPLIEEYALLKNLPKGKIHSIDLITEYAEGAFKKK